MRYILLYSVLLGMVLISTPKSLLHNCVHSEHKCHHHDPLDTDADGKNNGLTFELADCDQCSYYFQSIDTPIVPLRFLSANASNASLAMNALSFSIGAIQYPKLRGPPALVTI
ncbi:MAG: hypothetical protein ISP70_02760 [Crocinitomicaceae bacterium]|nr:hypothetical protein [Crocinitomicaceae bacterium]|tara:strand:- start:122 stop:460 length:339 start_codon:yes stop_codon:yes gene_type:complete